MKKGLRNSLFYIIFIAIVVLIVVLLLQNGKSPKQELESYSDVVLILDDVNAYMTGTPSSGTSAPVTGDTEPDDTTDITDKPAVRGKYSLKEIFVGNDNILTLVVFNSEDKTETTFVYKLRDVEIFRNDLGSRVLELIREDGSTITVEYEPANEASVWLVYLPYIIIIVVFIIIYIVAMRKMVSGGDGARINNFGKARTKTPASSKEKVLFKDVAGADEEKEELEEVVDFLKDPGKYTRLGARIPRGVLLIGPPGTGKTLLAKAVAGEADVPFFSISGSDFVEMYVGVGASRVRDLFDTARKAPASIIFIDEIDAVGRHRGAGLGGGHDEREQTLNQLLVEMDGFGSHDGVIVMAATNRPDILDPALLRPGRFDRQVTVNVPDIKGREEILKVHARNKPLEPDVSLPEVARMTSGFTGADLANLLNEAALLAARRKKNLIGMEDISDSYIKIVAGAKKKTRVIKDKEKRNTAYHEAGHAILAHLLGLDPVQQISIIPSGNALGYTLNPPTEDKFSVYKNELKNKLAMLLGGRAAEALIFGDISGGASNDIKRATDIAKRMVTRLGMSDLLGPRSFGTDQDEVFLGRDFSSTQDYSDETASKIDNEIHQLIKEAYNLALKLLHDNIDKLHFIADYLVRYEIMDGEQFKTAMENDGVTIEQIAEIGEKKKQRSKDANGNVADSYGFNFTDFDKPDDKEKTDDNNGSDGDKSPDDQDDQDTDDSKGNN